MKHADLIARLEKLTGADREVDALIEIEVRRLLAYAVGLDDQTRARWLIVGFKGEVEDGSVRYHSPEYTASLDAAVGLVERMLPGWSYQIQRRDACSVCRVARLVGDQVEGFDAGHNHSAIALLIALLRALQESDNER